MTKDYYIKTGFRVILGIVLIILISPLSLYLIYRDLFHIWNWFDYTIITSLITILCAFAITAWDLNQKSYIGSGFAYGVTIFVIVFIIFSPNYEDFNLPAVPYSNFAMIVQIIIHSISYGLISKDVGITLRKKYSNFHVKDNIN